MTATPTHAEIIAACDVLIHSPYTVSVTNLSGIKARAEKDLAAQKQADEELGAAFRNRMRIYLDASDSDLAWAVRNAISDVNARIVPAGEQPAADTIEAPSGPARSDWDRTVLAGDPIPDDLVTAFRRAVERSAADPANVLNKHHVHNLAAALREAGEPAGELIGYRIVIPADDAPPGWRLRIESRRITPVVPHSSTTALDGDRIAALYLLPEGGAR